MGMIMLGIGPSPSVAAPPIEAKQARAPAVPKELGRIAWLRGFEAAARRAKAERKPLLVLFQEVPGCSTCVNYGNRVLSHPLLRDAAESLFVPVAVYNNIKGDDERTLTSFKEAAWNNPVVRIITPDRKPLAPRVAGDYSIGGLASSMVAALKSAHRDVPAYLALLAEECAARKRGLKRATFAMHCFWEGEGALGNVRGVITTMPGFLDEKEVVEVEFDPESVDYKALVARAKALKCASEVFARDTDQQAVAKRVVGAATIRTDAPVRPDKQPKYYLSKTEYRHIPMTSLQATRVNAALGRKENPDAYLSPGQLRLLASIRKHPKAKWPGAIGVPDLSRAWLAAERVALTIEGADSPRLGSAGGG
ncbi:MAG: VPGUxxT family thioredoxin-like (seleno)protein, type 2 [Phycisphaerae bacterium]